VRLLTEHGFGEFYRRNARPLWTYIYRVTGHAADADDIVQDAFVRILKVELPEDEEEQRRYLFRVAGNLMADRWRRTTRERAKLDRAQAPAPPAAADTADVRRIFGELKPRERALLWLAYVEEEDHAGIAESLGIARGSVKVLLSRARARIRDLLQARGVVRNS